MEKNILITIIIAILVLVAVLCGGYYIYLNYVIDERPSSVGGELGATPIPGGPKEAYIKYLTEVNKAETLEDFYKVVIRYGYFDSAEQKDEATTTSAADIKKIPPSQKIQELKYLRGISQTELVAAPQLTEAINGETAVLSSPDKGLTVNMIKEQGSWKIK